MTDLTDFYALPLTTAPEQDGEVRIKKDNSDRGVSNDEKVVLACIKREQFLGTDCLLSATEIAHRCGISVDAVTRATSNLLASGAIENSVKLTRMTLRVVERG